MRVCLISKQFNPSGGGSERYAHALANALARRGHHVDVFTLGTPESLANVSVHDQVSVTFVARRHRPLVTFETMYYSLLSRRAINFDRYDVLHGTLMPASPIALTIRPPSTPLIVTSHGTSIGEVRSHKLELPTDYLKKLVFHPMNVLMDVATAPRVTRVIAISSVAERELLRWYPVDEDALVHVPHGVDAERFHPGCRRHPAVCTDRFTLLHIGRLVSRKHVNLALKALAVLDRDDVELLVAGTGPHCSRLEARSEQLGVSDQTSFLGFVPDEKLPSLYASSNAVLFLSRYEGFGLTFLESMAAGTPVIGTPVGGFPDVVTDGEDGLVVDRDATEVAEAIGRLADTPELTMEMGEDARAVARKRTWDTVAAQTEKVYCDVLG